MSRATDTGAGHVGELALRRHRAGEAVSGEVAAHVAACADCRARGRALDDEQRRFERDVSFDRFAAGIERATRGDRRGRPAAPRAWVLAPVLAVAAALALVVTFTPGPRGPNRTKGGAFITVRVAGADGTQRTADDDGVPARLDAGDRVRIGYEADGYHYLLALSVDEHGAVTPLYPEAGRSLSTDPADAPVRFLPDSVEFTGAGAEQLVVVLSDQPLEVEAARRAARDAYDRAHGDVRHQLSLRLPGAQFQRTFIKP
jgi:hypothetical protein